jgi:hypothetical protein
MTHQMSNFQLIFKTTRFQEVRKTEQKKGKKNPRKNFTGNEIGNQCRSLSLTHHCFSGSFLLQIRLEAKGFPYQSSSQQQQHIHYKI